MSLKRVHYHQRVWEKEDGEVCFGFSGDSAVRLARCFAPTPETFRRMLYELRQKTGFSVAGMAAFLGVPRVTLRKWEGGQRKPSGAAKRLIWLLHRNPDALQDPGPWLSWSTSVEESNMSETNPPPVERNAPEPPHLGANSSG